MSMMIVVSNISKSSLRTFSFLILTVTIASTFDFGDPMYGDNEMRGVWKRSNAELINGLIGMDLGKLTRAGKRSVSPLITNDDNTNSNYRFNSMYLKKLLSN
ncbi:Pigment dispersing factor [Dirofilaria immitis]